MAVEVIMRSHIHADIVSQGDLVICPLSMDGLIQMEYKGIKINSYC